MSNANQQKFLCSIAVGPVEVVPLINLHSLFVGSSRHVQIFARVLHLNSVRSSVQRVHQENLVALAVLRPLDEPCSTLLACTLWVPKHTLVNDQPSRDTPTRFYTRKCPKPGRNLHFECNMRWLVLPRQTETFGCFRNALATE